MRQYALLFVLFLAVPTVWAQESTTDDSSFAEDELAKEEENLQRKMREKVDYSELKQATEYSDMIVIQKTMLPKSQRIRVMGGISFLPNDVFYTTFGLDGRIGYDFNETWGIEGELMFLTSIKGRDLEGLEEKQRVTVDNLSTLKNFWGVTGTFTPFYGKTAFINDKIIPFEVYTLLGVGKVDAGNSSQSTAFKIGFGELFSWNKDMALRVELSALFYKSKTIVNTDQNSNVLLLTIGFDRFLTKVGDR